MKKSIFVLILSVLPLLSGCITTAISGVSAVGVVAAQERSAGNAVDDVSIRLALNNLYINKDVKDLYRNIGIRVSEGRVLLTGAVSKPESSVEAVRIAWTVKGVREVINEIQVNDKSGIADYVRDVWISTQIRTRMLLEKNLRSVNYNVETVNGVVYLMGIAQNQEELDKAKYLAGTTSYVNKVVSHVIMKDDPRRQK